MTATIVFNLIASIAVVAVLTAIFRLAYVVADHRPEDEAATAEAALPHQLERRAA